jgi:hypothetical protein
MVNLGYQCISTQAVACHIPEQSVRYHGNFYIKNTQMFLNSLLFFPQACKRHDFADLSSTVHCVLKRANYILIPISENISLLIKLQKWEQNWTNSCKLLSVPLFPLTVMFIEVKNLSYDWKYTRNYLQMLYTFFRKNLYCEIYGFLNYI